MFFYSEYTQNKEFSSLFLVSYLVRYLPVIVYTWDFLKHVSISEQLTGSHSIEICLVILIVISSIWTSKPLIDPDTRIATFRHFEIIAQALAFIYSTFNLYMVIHVSYSDY